MNIKMMALGAIAFSALAAAAVPASATINVGDALDLQYNFPGLGSVYQDSGNFTFTGAGQSLTTQFGITTVVLNGNEVAFEESPGCGTGCTQTPSSWNGPVLFDLTNGTAFGGWSVLRDTVGITSSLLTPGEIGVNWQGALVQGSVVVGVPEPSSWAMLMLGFAGLGYAGYRKTRGAAALTV